MREQNQSSKRNRTPEEDQILKQLGNHIRRLRNATGMSQEEVAAKAGFGRSYYVEIETGRRNTSYLNLYKLAKCLGVSVPELLDVDAASDEAT